MTDLGTHPKVRDGLGDHLGGPGQVERSTRRSRTGRDPPRSPVRVGGPTQKTRTGRETFPEVQDGLVDPPGGPGRVWGPFWRSGTCRGTLPEVRDGSGDPLGGLE